MADSISLNLNIENSLQQTLKETQTTMKSFNSLLERAQGNFAKLDKTADTLVDHYDDIEESQMKITKSTGSWLGGLQKVGGVLKSMAGPFLAIFGGLNIGNAVKQTLELNTQMQDLSFRMGEAGRTTGLLKDAVLDTAQATGIATEEAMALVTQLRELRVPSELVQEMATNTARFSEITGVTADNAARLSGELMRVGRLGADSTTEILAGMVQVQRAVGMTAGEMQELSEGIIESTKMLNQMGKSAAQIESFNKGVVKLAGAFTQVGLSAADANKFVSELLDPGRVEENAFLYAKLGVSLEEAFAGDVDPGMLASRFKDLGNELRNMSGPAASAMAQQLGMPLGQLRQMAEMDLSELEQTFAGGASGAEQLASAQDEQLSAQERMEKSMNRVQNSMVEMFDQLMPTVDKLAKWFERIVKFVTDLGPKMKWAIVGVIILAIKFLPKLRQKFFSVATDTQQAIRTAIVEGMDQGSRKGAEMMRKNVSGRAVDRAARMAGGPEAEAMSGRAEEFQIMAGGNLTKGVQRMTEQTAQTLQNLSMYGKPLSRMNMLTQQNNQVIADRLGMIQQEGSMMTGLFETRSDMLVQQQRELDTRLEYLDTVKMTAEQEWEHNKLLKQREALTNQINKAESEIAFEVKRMEARQERALARLSEDQLRNMYQEQQAQREILESQRRASSERISGLEKSRELIRRNMKENQGNFLVLKQLREEEDRISAEINEQNALRAQTSRQIGEIRKEQKRLTQAARGADIMDPRSAAKAQTIWRRTGNFLRSNLNKAAQGIDDAFDKARNSARQIGRNLRETLSPRNMMARVRRRFSAEGREAAQQRRAQGGGMMGALGKLAKIAGPVMIIARLLSSMEPVQKVIEDTLQRIKPFLQKLGEKLAPIIERLVNAFMPVLDILITALMPVIDLLAEVFGDFLAKLGPIFVKLIQFLLPPVVKLLGILIQVLGKVIETVGKAGKFVMELPDRFLFALPKALGGRGRDMSEEQEQQREVRFAEIEAEIDRRGLRGREKRQFRREMQAIADQELGIGEYEASEQLQQNAVYQFFSGIEEMGTRLVEAGKDLYDTEFDFSNIATNFAPPIADAARDGVEAGMSGAVTRTWTPAMVEATEEGLRVRDDIQESFSARTSTAAEETASHSEETAVNTQRVADAQEAMVEMQSRSVDQQSEIIAALRTLSSSIATLSSRLS